MMASSLLAGKVIAITGAGRGNGRAMALGLSSCGAQVLATDLDPASANDTAARIVAAGGLSVGYCVDVTDVASCAAFIQRVIARGLRLDGLVNNAGTIVRESLSSISAQTNFARVLDVNLHGVFNMTIASLPMLRASNGAVVNVTSIASFVGLTGSVGYSASKGAVRLLTQSMAAELASERIRVNAIAPGVIDTPMTASLLADRSKAEKLLSRIPMGRAGRPEELVGAVAFLLSPLASYITGATLPVDGGYLAG
uniref:SDR family NAD(P)-dependent oxidoreductase n=1 Tax=Limnohabitans sp. TaxID=1907725 RepID=UPI00404798EF